MPLTFANPDDYDAIAQGDMLSISGVYEGMDTGAMTLCDETSGKSFMLSCAFTERQKDILKAGGLLAYTKVSGGK